MDSASQPGKAIRREDSSHRAREWREVEGRGPPCVSLEITSWSERRIGGVGTSSEVARGRIMHGQERRERGGKWGSAPRYDMSPELIVVAHPRAHCRIWLQPRLRLLHVLCFPRGNGRRRPLCQRRWLRSRTSCFAIAPDSRSELARALAIARGAQRRRGWSRVPAPAR